MTCMIVNPAIRRYLLGLCGSLIAYALCLFLSIWVFIHHHPAGVLAYVLAILPSIPIVGMLGVFGRYLAEEKDEFQRAIFVQSMLWSLGATLAATTMWGFLEDFVHVPHVQLVMVFPIFCFFWAIATPLVMLRYR